MSSRQYYFFVLVAQPQCRPALPCARPDFFPWCTRARKKVHRVCRADIISYVGLTWYRSQKESPQSMWAVRGTKAGLSVIPSSGTQAYVSVRVRARKRARARARASKREQERKRGCLICKWGAVFHMQVNCRVHRCA